MTGILALSMCAQVDWVSAETLEQAMTRDVPVISSKPGGAKPKSAMARVLREQNDFKTWQLASKQSPIPLPGKAGGSKPQTDISFTNAFTGKLTPHGAILIAYHRNGKDSWCTGTVSGYCHAGIFNRLIYRDETSLAIRTANTGTGMLLESPRYWRHFNEVREMEVWAASDKHRAEAVKQAMSFKGGYMIGLKFTKDTWYCSKVVHRAYLDAISLDLDADGGAFVFPGDLRWSIYTKSLRVYLP